MPDKKPIAIIGYSGHSFVVLDAAKQMDIEIKYYCEKEQASYDPFQINYLGDERSESFNWETVDDYILGIGDNKIRQKVASLILSKNKVLLNVIHPKSLLSDYSILGKGNFIAANVTVNAFAKIGDHCILNTGCIVEHECIVESGAHIAPGAVLAGNVYIGKNAFVGANSVVKQGVNIGNGAIIGAGSVVINNIPDNEVWVGNPASKIK